MVGRLVRRRWRQGRGGLVVVRLSVRPACGRSRHRGRPPSHRLQSRLLRGPPTRSSREGLDPTRRAGDRVAAVPAAGLRPLRQLSARIDRPRRPAECLLRQLRRPAAGACDPRLPGAGGESQRVVYIRRRFHEGRPAGLGGRGLRRHHGLTGRNRFEAVRRRRPHRDHRLQLWWVHERLGGRAGHDLQGRCGGRAVHRSHKHVRHVGHRGHLWRGPVGRPPRGGAAGLSRAFADHLCAPCRGAGAADARRGRRQVSHRTERAVLRRAEEAG